jgi:hypothetical protein
MTCETLRVIDWMMNLPELPKFDGQHLRIMGASRALAPFFPPQLRNCR